MTSMMIVCNKEEVSDEMMRNFADWLLIDNGWVSIADRILINNKEYYEVNKDGKIYAKLREDFCICSAKINSFIY